MKNLIAISQLCLSAFILGSCASSGVIAENDVYMQQPTATNLFEDETDPTSYANFKAQERNEIVVVTETPVTPIVLNRNVTTLITFGPTNPYFAWGGHMRPVYQNGFFQGVAYMPYSTFGYGYSWNSPYMYYNNFYPTHNHYAFGYGYGYNYGYGYGGYIGYGLNGHNGHNQNHFYGHRKSSTVYARRNSNTPSTLKNKQANGNVSRQSYSAATYKSQANVKRREVGNQLTVGNTVNTNNTKTYTRNGTRVTRVASRGRTSYSNTPTNTFTSSSSSSSAPTRTQSLGASSRRVEGSRSTGRSNTLSVPSPSRSRSVSSPNRSSSSPKPAASSGTRRSSGGGSTQSSRRR